MKSSYKLFEKRYYKIFSFLIFASILFISFSHTGFENNKLRGLDKINSSPKGKLSALRKAGNSFNSSVIMSDPVSDSLALVEFYWSTGGPNWTDNTNWLVPGMSIDTWYGVTINGNGCVSCIDLDGEFDCTNNGTFGGNNLIGVIPAEIGNLQNLITLNLSSNQLTGGIPIEIGNLNNLETLLFRGNQLTGDIPLEIGNLLSLHYLDLSSNQLTGNILEDIGNLINLTHLWINNNLLTGEIPPEIGNLTNLTHLWISGNSLTGEIPPEIGNLLNLQDLFLSGNQLSGQIPSEIGNLQSLSSLNLSNNQLSGQIPIEIGNLQSLFSCWLDYNMLTGGIPSEFGNLNNLVVLRLNFNNLSDLIPANLLNATNLFTFWLEHNSFSFQDLLPIVDFLDDLPADFYSPQDTIFKDTTYVLSEGNNLNIDLLIDEDITDNEYQWFKDDLPFANYTGDNNLNFPNLLQSHSGIYRVEVTNPNVDGLTLNSYPISIIVVACDQVSDSLALVELYNATDGVNWATPWNLNQPMSTWNGVSLNTDGCVEELNLFSRNLNGTLPDLNLSNLKKLRILNSQNLSGAIPDFSNLPMLDTLNLGGNGFTSIPNFTNLPSLVEINVTSNALTGELHDFTLPVLEEFFLGFNQLNGAVPNFSGMPNLRKLHFQNNDITGTVPEFTMLPNLNQLVINDNQLDTFMIQNTFINSQQLFEWVLLYNNNFTFDDLITNTNQINIENLPDDLIYAPQNPLEGDTVINTDIGTDVLINSLGFDDTVSTSVYTWFHNGQQYSTGSTQELSIPNVQADDAGIYTIIVTNENVLGLTLEGFTLTLNVINPACDPVSDSLALVAFYNSTGGLNWTDDTNWLVPGMPIETWYGVTTNGEGCVTNLSLINNLLIGEIPLNIEDLQNIETIRLSSNQLSGEIPPQIGNLQNLSTFNLSNNDLSGEIPPEISNLQNLESLNLGSNLLTGNIPPEIDTLQNLLFLNLSNNDLSGEILPEISNLQNLEHFYLNLNMFSGEIPPELCSLQNLESLNLGSNLLTGNIPSEIGNLQNLLFLNLSNNDLSGEIPPELCSLQNLEYFYANSNVLSGEIPPEIDTLQNLTHIYLNSNQFSGEIPPEIGNLENLIHLELNNNQLFEIIPLELQNLSNLLLFNFDSNFFTFQDILPNINFIEALNTSQYSPQALIFKDTTYTILEGEDLEIDLLIDENIIDNEYQWYKDDIAYANYTGDNNLSFTNLQQSDEGTYHVEVTNPQVNGLILTSYPININVTACDRVSDSIALSELYFSTSGANWEAPWNTANDLNNWDIENYVIGFTTDGCIKHLNLFGRNLDGTFPNINLSSVDTLRVLNDSLLTGVIPNFENAPMLRLLNLGNNGFTSMPDTLKLPLLKFLGVNSNRLTGDMIDYDLPELREIFYSENQLSGVVPDFQGMPVLEKLHFHSNDITGVVPRFTNLDSLSELSIYNNQLDSFSLQIDFINSGQEFRLIELENNRFTFDDIIPNITQMNFTGSPGDLSYSPQALIYQEESIITDVGEEVIIDLLIDDTVTTNIYEWLKNDVPYDTIYGDNRLIFPNISQCDTGTYVVQVTNPNASALTLVSYPIDISVTCPIITIPLVETICQGENYQVGDSIYTETGLYNQTLSSSRCCDSIVSLNLTVQSSFNTDLGSISICEGESYSVGDSTYTTTDFYQNILQTVNGCDSIIDLNLIVNVPTNNNLGIISVCEGESYSVGDSTYVSSGNYITVLQNINGCDSIVDLTLSVLDTSITNITTTICEGESYSVGNTTYTTSGNYIDLLQKLNNCDSTVNLILTVLDTAITDLSVTICEGEVYMVGNSAYTLSGNYTNLLQTFEGCDSTVNLDLIVHPTYEEDLGLINICEGEAFTIGTSIFTTTGEHSVTLQTIENCDSIINFSLAVLDTMHTHINASICEGENFTVGTSDYTVSGMYQDTLPSFQSCDSIIFLNLLVSPSTPLTEMSANICEGESYTVGSFTFNTTGMHEVMLNNENGCDSIIMLELTVISEESTGIANAGEDVFECEPNTLIIGNQPPNTYGVWYNPNSVDIADPNASITNVEHLQPGENVFIWTLSTDDCMDYSADTMIITLDTLTPIAFDDIFILKPNSKITELNILDNDELYGFNDWKMNITNFPSSGLLEVDDDNYPLTYEPDPDFIGSVSFEYELCNPFCEDYCNKAVVLLEVRPYVEEGTEVNIIITPNGDELNEFLTFDNLDQYPENEILITNRWGSLVYQAQPYRNEWNGQNQNGKTMAEGTYYFILRLDIGEGKFIWGSVTVNR